MAFFHAGVLPEGLPQESLLILPWTFMVLTLSTLTPKSCSTARPMSIFVADLATSKVYFLCLSPSVEASVTMGLIIMSWGDFILSEYLLDHGEGGLVQDQLVVV